MFYRILPFANGLCTNSLSMNLKVSLFYSAGRLCLLSAVRTCTFLHSKTAAIHKGGSNLIYVNSNKVHQKKELIHHKTFNEMMLLIFRIYEKQHKQVL